MNETLIFSGFKESAMFDLSLKNVNSLLKVSQTLTMNIGLNNLLTL